MPHRRRIKDLLGRGYWPDNCRWATVLQQANNKTTNVLVTVDGEDVTTAEAARRADINPATIRRRLQCGWPKDMVARKMSRRELMEAYRLYAS